MANDDELKENKTFTDEDYKNFLKVSESFLNEFKELVYKYINKEYFEQQKYYIIPEIKKFLYDIFNIQINTSNTFEKELENILNKYSKENDSDTPDFLLAEYLINCLKVYNITINKREKWYGREDKEIDYEFDDYYESDEDNYYNKEDKEINVIDVEHEIKNNHPQYLGTFLTDIGLKYIFEDKKDIIINKCIFALYEKEELKEINAKLLNINENNITYTTGNIETIENEKHYNILIKLDEFIGDFKFNIIGLTNENNNLILIVNKNYICHKFKNNNDNPGNRLNFNITIPKNWE